MTDEFAKGFGILVTAGFGWMILAGWYNTPSFQGIQLLGSDPQNVGGLADVALMLKEVLFWFAILGALTFWIVIPAVERARESVAE